MELGLSIGIAAGSLLAAFGVLVGWLLSSTKVRGVDPEWAHNFSPRVYHPMERLLSEEDILFIRSQPGYDPAIERTLRKNRRRVFRSYLRALGKDFSRLHLALRLSVLASPVDRSDLAMILVRQRVIFLVGLSLAHIRLSLYGLGLSNVNVRGLISTLETMRSELGSLSPMATAA
jgi:hypothetical protein